MFRITGALILVLAASMCAAELVIAPPDIVAVEAHDECVTASLTPAKAAEFAQAPMSSWQLHVVLPVPGKGVYLKAATASTITLHFPDAAAAATFVSAFAKSERKP